MTGNKLFVLALNVACASCAAFGVLALVLMMFRGLVCFPAAFGFAFAFLEANPFVGLPDRPTQTCAYPTGSAASASVWL